MMESSRTPLGVHASANIPRTHSKSSSKDYASLYKHAQLEAADERRKRAEVEGALSAAQHASNVVKEASAALTIQLAEAQAELRMQKDTIIRLSSASHARPTAAEPSTDWKEKLLGLKKKHDEVKAEFTAKLDSASTDNKSLQSLVDSLQATNADLQRSVTSLRSDKAALQQRLTASENAQPKAGADDGKYREERAAWRREKIELEAKLKTARKVSSRTDEIEKQRRAVEVERDALEERVDQVTYLYRLRYRSTVPAERLIKAEGALAEERITRIAAEHERDVLNDRAQRLAHLNDDLGERLRELTADRVAVEADVAALLSFRAADRDNLSEATPSEPPIAPLETLDPLPIFDAALAHMDIAIPYHSAITVDTLSSLHSLRAELDTARAAQIAAQTSVVTLRASLKAAEDNATGLEVAHGDCAQTISDLKSQATRAGVIESRLRSELSNIRIRAGDLEEQLLTERDRLHRANETNGRGGAAREALEDEVEELRNALAEHRDTAEHLGAMQQERDLLQLRLESTVAELEELEARTAGLMSHANEGQRLSYMDGLRREMALVKHELAGTRHHLNIANERVDTLESEVEAYKAIGPSVLAASSGRVRVSRQHTRREPEGGEVLGASMVRRTSISRSGR